MQRSASFSPCREYRYSLSRTWDRTLPVVLFVGLNPSTADDKSDDPTVRRCIGFATKWRFGGLILVNLFAYRTTDPRRLSEVEDPIGPDNDRWLAVAQARAARVVAAWGNQGAFLRRDENVLGRLGRTHCLGVTKTGSPRHPLYLSAKTRLQIFGTWQRRGAA